MADGIVGKISVGDGATFTPSVNSDGVLSWSNNKNLPNPADFDIPAEIINSGAMTPGSESGTIAFGGNDVAVTGWEDKANVSSPAFSGTPTAPTPASSDNSTKLATTEFVNTKAGNYLPLTGGTMTGAITSSTDTVLRRPTTDGFSMLCGSTAYSTGAHLRLYGKDAATHGGSFLLLATDANNTITLEGRPDGTLAWGGQNVLTAANYNSYALPLSGGTMTGAITRSGAAVVANTSNNASALYLNAFSDGTNGAQLGLYGKDHAGIGRFSLNAMNGNTIKSLNGYPDGTLTWDGNNVLTAANYNSYALPLTGGTMSGSIIFGYAGYYLARSVDNGNISMFGGTSATGGASVYLFGKDESRAGQFWLTAWNGTTQGSLVGEANGTLTWNGQPIQTSSDKRLKQDFADVPDEVLEAWGKVEWKQFKYKADVERKGENCRFHTGLVAQDVKEVGDENNVDLLKYGILCHDVREAVEEEKDEDGNVIKEASEAVDLWTIRYEEALAMEAAYQRRRADRLEERIEALEKLLMNRTK